MKSVIIGTQWTQARIAEKNVEKEKWRKACEPSTEGTLQHRHTRCNAYRQVRDENLNIPSRCRLKDVGGDIFKKYGILMKRELPKRRRQIKWEPKWINEAAPKVFRGTVYVDGSGKMCRWEHTLSTAAWAAVIISDNANQGHDVDRIDLWEQCSTDGAGSSSEEVEEECNCKSSCSPWDTCDAYCVVHAGCNGKCRKKNWGSCSKKTEDTATEGGRRTRIC